MTYIYDSYNNLDDAFTLAYGHLKIIETELAGYSAIALNAMPKSSNEINVSIDNSSNKNISDATKLCNLVQKIAKYQKIVTGLTNLFKGVNDIFNWLQDKLIYLPAQILIKYVTLITLRIKKIILNIKLWIAKLTKKILIALSDLQGSPAMAVLVMPIIYAIAAIATAISYILLAVQSILNLLPELITVEPFGMAFIFSIKKMLNGSIFGKEDMKIITSTGSVFDRLPDAIKTNFYTITKASDEYNKAIKIASISAGAAAGVAMASVAANEASYDFCASLNKLKEFNPNEIFKQIELIVMGLMIPFPLPKYEKLSITNIGYLNWLMTSFNFAGHNAFGIPGFP